MSTIGVHSQIANTQMLLQEIDMTRRERRSIAQFLDDLVPLNGASHSEVIDYKVTVPMRNAELSARLANGNTARLANSRQFLGWAGYGANPTLLFDCDGRKIVVDTGNEQRVPPQKFVTPNGGQIASGVMA